MLFVPTKTRREPVLTVVLPEVFPPVEDSCREDSLRLNGLRPHRDRDRGSAGGSRLRSRRVPGRHQHEPRARVDRGVACGISSGRDARAQDPLRLSRLGVDRELILVARGRADGDRAQLAQGDRSARVRRLSCSRSRRWPSASPAAPSVRQRTGTPDRWWSGWSGCPRPPRG